MSEAVSKKVIELKCILNELGLEVISEKPGQYRIDNKKAVKWGRDRVRIGKIYSTNRLRVDIDFPVRTFSLEKLRSYVGLPHEDEINNKVSYFNCTIDGDRYDTIRVFLLADRLESYNFKSANFQEFLRLMYKANN